MWSNIDRRDETVTVLAANEETKIKVYGCKEVKWKLYTCRIFYILTLGFLRLLFYWKPTWRVSCTCEPCILVEAQLVLIMDDDHEWYIRQIFTERRPKGLSLLKTGGITALVDSYRYFTHRKVLYVWYPELNEFHRVFNLDYQVQCNFLHEQQPLTTEDADSRHAAYGNNEIYVELKPIWRLLSIEVANPFYLFQVFSMGVWFAENYNAYAVIIIIITLVSISVNVWQVRRSQRALRDTIASTGDVTVIRDDILVTKPSMCLVPGDIVIIPSNGCTMQCDAVLLTGTCIVNESMLTGESVPVTKTPVPIFGAETSSTKEGIYNDKVHSKHTLYNGTIVLQTRYYANQHVKALVIRTGFNTTKGQLVRSIMYPKPVDFEFTKDLLKFVSIMGVLALVGFCYSIGILITRGAGVTKAIIEACDVITIVVPPALPAAMTIGIIAAQDRLKKKLIYCISPSTINTCGGINAVCFDKTGTLTEDGLGLLGVLAASSDSLGSDIRTPAELGDDDDVVQAMASCHSLTRIDNALTGDPLDVILFQETGWELEEPETVQESDQYDKLAPTVVRPVGNKSLEIGIIRQFTFSSSLQRMSVVARLLGSDHYLLYCKGAPETVAALCTSDSVPKNFYSALHRYAKKGYRVLAVGMRKLDVNFVKVQRLPREQLECELRFLGLVILENRLKPETTPNISLLRAANIRTVMVTGDNILTAISVARDCTILDEIRPLYTIEVEEVDGMANIKLSENENQLLSNGVSVALDSDDFLPSKLSKEATYQLAISGPSFALLSKHFSELVLKVVAVCNIFARMAPEQKGSLINAMQELGYIVAMCGDGANDCGALKAAHAGISLSEAEASIASPFTSKVPNISCVPKVISEGRAALVTSFGVFKYMVAYSFTQFISVAILYYINTNLSSYQYLYIDLVLTTVFALFFGYTEASEIIEPRRPPTRILTVASLASIFMQLSVVFLFQMAAFQFVTIQPWFVPFVNPYSEDYYYAFQANVVFCTSIFQYLSLAIIYSKARPYRKAIFTNRYFSISLLVLTCLSIWITVDPPWWLAYFLALKVLPSFKYRVFIVVLGALDFLVAMLVETYVIDYLLFQVAENRGWCQRSAPPKHVTLMHEIETSTHWLTSNGKKKTKIENSTSIEMSISNNSYDNFAAQTEDEKHLIEYLKL